MGIIFRGERKVRIIEHVVVLYPLMKIGLRIEQRINDTDHRLPVRFGKEVVFFHGLLRIRRICGQVIEVSQRHRNEVGCFRREDFLLLRVQTQCVSTDNPVLSDIDADLLHQLPGIHLCFIDCDQRIVLFLSAALGNVECCHMRGIHDDLQEGRCRKYRLLPGFLVVVKSIGFLSRDDPAIVSVENVRCRLHLPDGAIQGLHGYEIRKDMALSFLISDLYRLKSGTADLQIDFP